MLVSQKGDIAYYVADKGETSYGRQETKMKASRRRGEGSNTSVGEERAQARIEYFRAGLAQVAQFDEGVKAEIEKLVRKDEGLKDLQKVLAKAAKAHQRASESVVSGKLSRAAAQAMINEAFAPLAQAQLHSSPAKTRGPLAGQVARLRGKCS